MKTRSVFFLLIIFTMSPGLLGQMTVKNSTEDILMEVNDEGDFGSIMLLSPTSSTPTTTTNKLYNIGGMLYWNGSVLGVGSNSWNLTGNSGTTPGTHFIGTTDNQALEFKVNSTRVLRLEPTSACPNLIGGLSTNLVTAGVVGATISGGGGTNQNLVTDDYGTIGGGQNNQAGDNGGSTSDRFYATVGGGLNNKAIGEYSTISGGRNNTAGAPMFATIGGGESNTSSGLRSTVAGGESNVASSSGSAVGGGWDNTASGGASTVAGGEENTASGQFSAIPGGSKNTAQGYHSFAAGRRAKANHNGSFVWADPTDADFATTAEHQFLIRANGGVGIGKTSPTQALDVAGTVQMTGFQMPTGATNGYVLTSDGSGVGTWQAVTGGGSDGDWTISGSDMYAAVSGNVGIGTSGALNEKLVLENGNFYIKGGNSLLRGTGGGQRVEYIQAIYLTSSESYCEVEIQGANPGDAAMVVEAHHICGNGYGGGAAYGKQIWIISCEGGSSPSTIVEYPGEYDEASNNKITLDGASGPIIRIKFHRRFAYDNGSVRILLFGGFNPETVTFTSTNHL
ncbi:hypothetical protein EH223_08870 [candidate division KSB1 bacterium]|nr:hypothetical protein [candidate division KSB1 bacterium]RQW03834.1 MAG: hypothetical protein EH223_08870 [candidate division KSB1 bacterium]